MADLFTLAEADDLERRRAARARIHKLARAIGKDDWRWLERRVRKLPGFKGFDVLDLRTMPLDDLVRIEKGLTE